MEICNRMGRSSGFTAALAGSGTGGAGGLSKRSSGHLEFVARLSVALGRRTCGRKTMGGSTSCEWA